MAPNYYGRAESMLLQEGKNGTLVMLEMFHITYFIWMKKSKTVWPYVIHL